MEKYTSGCKGCIREFGCDFEETRARADAYKPKCYIKVADADLIDRSSLKPDLCDADVNDGTTPVHYSKDTIENAPSISARPKRYVDASHDTLISYIWSLEKEYYEGKHKDQQLDKILVTMYALYKAAWAIGEISWDNMFYAYADFTAKLLKIR